MNSEQIKQEELIKKIENLLKQFDKDKIINDEIQKLKGSV